MKMLKSFALPIFVAIVAALSGFSGRISAEGEKKALAAPGNLDAEGLVLIEKEGTQVKYNPKSGATWFNTKGTWKEIADKEAQPASNYVVHLYVSPTSGLSIVREDVQNKLQWTLDIHSFSWSPVGGEE